MMRQHWLCWLVLAASPHVLAHEQVPIFGLSDQFVAIESERSDVRERLQIQVDRGSESLSELSVQLHVDSQARLAETFRRPIPDRLRDGSDGQ